MNDEDKSKEQLINELAEMRQRIAELETSETLRKRAEDSLRVSEGHFRSLIESSQDSICHISLDGRFLSMNAADCAIYKLESPEEAIGKSCTESIIENREEAEEAVRRAARGETVALQYKSSSKTGKGIWWDSKLTPVRTADGTVKSILRISRDITERKKVYEELLSLKKAVESMQCGMTYADLEGRILYTNPAEARMHGYKVEELVGKNVRIYAPSERWNKIALKDMKEIEKTVKRESVNIRKDGSRFPVQLLSDAVTDSAGRIIGIVTSSEDITERKRLEEELLKVSKLESVSTLSGGIAHDFNNILTIILGKISFAKMLLKPDEETFQILSDAEKGFKRAKDLTNQLLTFSKGGAPIKKVIHISELIKESADLVLTGSNVRCVYSHRDGLWPVEVDEGQMSQVINNLLINAVQAMPNGGLIDVHAENVVIGQRDVLPLNDGKYVKIAIKDHGVGIPKEYMQRIFDPFFTTKEKGSGLGLATTYSIIRKHDGYITVESELGVGTTFHLYLPATAKEIETKTVSEERPVAGCGRVLIMDDEDVLRESTRDLLQHLGYEVETARDGLEAIKIYRKAKESGIRFDAVIIDLTIPGGMGGKEAITKLLEIDPDIKAIVSSGYSNDPIMADFRQHGFIGVVVKPYKIEELTDTLERLITVKKEVLDDQEFRY